jgi:thioesterase domain-containing protein
MPQDESAPGRAEWPTLSAPARLLRAGLGEPIFLFPGGGGDLRELDSLRACLHTKRPLVGVAYWETGVDGVEPQSVDAMATFAHNVIQAHQTHGLYSLVGYSIGGLVAVEIARRLAREGKSVAPPILIDAIPPISSWPKRALLRAIPALARRRILRLIRERLNGGEKPIAEVSETAQRLRLLYFDYRPRPYPGRIGLLYARNEPGYGGVAPKIWKGLANEVDSYPIDSTHIEILRDDSAVQTVAKTIDELTH